MARSTFFRQPFGQSMRQSLRIVSAILLTLALQAGAKDSLSELQKIEVLLDSVKASDVTFIRNGEEYTAKQAHDHLQRKLGAAQDSWFAPPKKQWTAEMFIEKIATRSSLTRKPYSVRFKNGKTVEARVWLTKMLSEVELASRSR